MMEPGTVVFTVDVPNELVLLLPNESTGTEWGQQEDLRWHLPQADAITALEEGGGGGGGRWWWWCDFETDI